VKISDFLFIICVKICSGPNNKFFVTIKIGSNIEVTKVFFRIHNIRSETNCSNIKNKTVGVAHWGGKIQMGAQKGERHFFFKSIEHNVIFSMAHKGFSLKCSNKK
jgi:hypothetical protein